MTLFFGQEEHLA